MAASSFVQDSFLGGLWTLFSQGRVKDPAYASALAECYNALPIEEGAWTRRGGTECGGHTRDGAAARVIEFAFTSTAPYNAELTDSHLRFWAGTELVADDSASVSQISTESPAVLTIGAPEAWVTGDQVWFKFLNDHTALLGAYLGYRQIELTRLTSTTFSLSDPISGLPIDGSKINWPLTGMSATVYHIADLATSYTAARLPDVRPVQSDLQLLLLHGQVSPLAVTAVVASPYATFSKQTPSFVDGPYLDPPSPIGSASPTTLTPSGPSGSVTFTANQVTGINGGAGFATTDVGRLLRIYSQPAAWAVGTTYAANNRVTYNNVTYYSVGAGNVGNQPDLNPALWSANPKLASWSYARITSRTNTLVVVATVLGANIPYTTASPIWALGVFSDTSGYPTCGCYHEGRIWLSGAVANRVDACTVDGFATTGAQIDFAPTDTYGAVSDASGISYVFNSTKSNKILWMQPSAQGIVCGTEGGEWLIQASGNDQVITPTSIQAHPVTSYGCANVEPKRTGLSTVFVQKHKRKLLEYLSDAFSGRFAGPNLSSRAKSLTKSGIAELAYQEEPAPIVWMRMNDGSLAGTTYRRMSQFSTQPPEFNGWHRHALGSLRDVDSIAVGPMAAEAGTIDTLAMITNDTTNVRYFELMRRMFDEEDVFETQWHVDCGIVPIAGRTIDGGAGLRFYGLNALRGKTVACVVGGLDCGDHTVNQDGYVDVPYVTSNALLTYTYLANLSISGKDFADLEVAVDEGKLRVPVVIGYNYRSRGQGLRPIAPADTGAQAGPGFAKVKRASSFGVLLVNTVEIYFGVDFDRMRKASFRSKSQGVLRALNNPFTGIFWDPLEDEYSMDSQFAWEIRRPWPCTMTAFGLFEHTEDRT